MTKEPPPELTRLARASITPQAVAGRWSTDSEYDTAKRRSTRGPSRRRTRTRSSSEEEHRHSNPLRMLEVTITSLIVSASLSMTRKHVLEATLSTCLIGFFLTENLFVLNPLTVCVLRSRSRPSPPHLDVVRARVPVLAQRVLVGVRRMLQHQQHGQGQLRALLLRPLPHQLGVVVRLHRRH
jgi:hypothetical protein